MEPGARVGAYELLGLLAQGGMGQVYAAVHARTGQRVAIKLLAEPAEGPLRARFLQEARILAALQHPGVVRILHFDGDSQSAAAPCPDRCYLVMELVEGPSLRRWLGERGRASVGQALRLLTRVAEALAVVHDHGVIHRDIKPENLLLRQGEEVVLVDFGIARAPTVVPRDPRDTWLETGAAGPRWLGTVTYMAPEQCRGGGPITPAADVYALGVVGYELLLGRPPFTGEDPLDVVAQHLRSPPDLRRLRGPAGLRALLRAMLAKDPAARPSSEQVAAELRRLSAVRSDRRRLLLGVPSVGAGLLWVAAIDRPRESVSTHVPGPVPTRLLLLAQPHLIGISEEEMLAALPRAYLRLPRARLLLAAPPPTPLDFAAAARALRAQLEEELRPLLQSQPDVQVVYFGVAPIPLALLLGAQLQGLTPIRVLLRHHRLQRFVYARAEGAPPPRLRPLALPAPTRAPGEVIVRVSTSHRVDEAATRALVPAALAEVDVALQEPLEDAFASEAEMAPVLEAFTRVLDHVGDQLPGVRRVHLFASVQGGLALLLGTRVSRTMHPAIQTYQYMRTQRPPFVPALVLNAPEPGGTPMDLQPLFRRFHGQIELTYDASSDLREMRDDVLRLLRDRLRARRGQTFTTFNQGSYAMGTGIKPPPGAEYDIDIGVVFTLERARYTAPEVKGWVHEALADTGKIAWRRPCVTVYRRKFHMDLAVFVEDRGQLYLAVGKQHAQDAHWQQDGLKDFIKEVEQRFPGQPEDSYQLRRVVRYLKRWKDQHFPADGRAAPTGNALTVCAYKWFRPRRSTAGHDNLAALLTLLDEVLRQFTGPRLKVEFPKAPRDDVFRKMSDEQMKQLRQRLEQLRGWLQEAQRQGSTAPLQRAFGADFPER